MGAMRPDWVLLGVRLSPEQVVVYASNQLTVAELEMKVETEMMFSDYPRHFPRRQTIRLSTEMLTVVYASGATYAEAIRTIMETWSPDERAGIGPGQPTLPT